MNKPNILLIMTDQQRWDALGTVSPWMRTPNMDRIAEEGVQFSNAITTSPVCIPARRTMASGLYAHTTGVWDNRLTRLNTPTWMSCIRDAGYRTSVFGKTHLNPHNGDLRDVAYLLHAQGMADVNETAGPRGCTTILSHMTMEWARLGLWDTYKQDLADRYSTKPYLARPSTLGLKHYYDTYVGWKACEYLEQYDRNEPWFCWVSFAGPHEPWDAPEPYASAYAVDQMPEALSGEMKGGVGRPWGRLDERLQRLLPMTHEDVAALRANYAGNVTLIDDLIGGIFEVIEVRREMENTVIALVSDHGEMNGDYGLLYKGNFLDSAARIPMLIRTPRTAAERQSDLAQRKVCTSPVEWFDLGPTLVELSGGEIRHMQFAKSLVPCLDNPKRRIREESLSEVGGEGMIRSSHWKLAVNNAGDTYLLFDLENDPSESHNLAGISDYQDVATGLRLRMRERVLESQLSPRRSPVFNT
ncbi:MAG TPA: sulfatase-like hydrolase/transferase [Casimicrobiaceae bacterium]|nr:sulfatase-like hydrolase/transferase [Casimicrobiaceae bacterium]